MKKIILVLLLVSSFTFAQDNSAEEYHKMYLEKIESYKNIFGYNEKVERYAAAIKDLYPAYNQIILMDNLPSISIQKALIKDYSAKYRDLFYIDKAKKNNVLKVGFATKSEYYEYLSLMNRSLEIQTILLIDDLEVSLNKKYVTYIDDNLKKLNISRSEFDKMTEKDQNTLIQTFK